MTDQHRDRVKSLFLAASELPESDRNAFLERECGEDEDLRAQVESLLEHASDPASEAPTSGAGRTEHEMQSLVDLRLGRYRILEKLGEGGMGIVYLAEQTEPIHRRVAVKIIKPGMDSRAVIARFEAEQQALERMEHPNIAKVLDAGTTERGLPYFVMEYVRGNSITQHADRERLNIEERLELFIQVCEALQHAHHKGIIHRDIKPSNILVEWEGQRAVPKVIDFGVARATHQSGDQLAFTQHGQLIGTPEYMSPEQAEMGAEDIDTRTDVYSLGVVLYELLTGILPFESSTLRQAGIDAIRRIIREVDPPVPSKRLRTIHGDGHSTVTDISRARGTDAKRLSRLLRNDLDWVVMKCLEKRRDRRYATPSALAQDLRRFLSGQTVLTGPPNLSYHLGKFVRRHRTGVLASTLVLVALGVGFVATFVQWQRAEASRNEAIHTATQLIDVFHDKVIDLPGAMRARQDLVALGVGSLERQRQRAGSDARLLLATAEGYDKLGDVAGGRRVPNRGNVKQAAGFYGTALALRKEVLDSRGRSVEVAVGFAQSALRRGDVHWGQGELAECTREYQGGLQHLEGIGFDDSESVDAVVTKLELMISLAEALARWGDRETGAQQLQNLQDAIGLADRTEREHGPGLAAVDVRIREMHARALHALGTYYYYTAQDSLSALQSLEDAEVRRARLFKEYPVSTLRRRRLAGTQFMAGYISLETVDSEHGKELLEKAVSHFEFLVEADPENAEARDRVSQILEYLTQRAERRGEVEDAILLIQDALKHLGGLEQNEARLFIRAKQEHRLARNLLAVGRRSKAVMHAASAYQSMETVLRAGDTSALEGLSNIAETRVTALKKLNEAGEIKTAAMLGMWEGWRQDLAQTIAWLESSENLDGSDESVQETIKALQEIQRRCESEIESLRGR